MARDVFTGPHDELGEILGPDGKIDPSLLPSVKSSVTTLLNPSGGDDTPQFSAAVAAGGTVALGPGTFTFLTSPGNACAARVERNTPVTVIGAGRGKTICQLSAAAQQLVGFHKIADYDSFSRVTVRDLTVDSNNAGVTHNTGAIVSSGSGGGFHSRINLDRITVQNVDSINLPFDNNNRCHIMLVVNHPAVGETQTNLTNILVESVYMLGGTVGVEVNGNGPASGGPGTAGTNVFIDHVHIRDWYHDTGATPDGIVGSGISANVQIGSGGFGGSDILIEDGYGKNSGDVGVEIDAVQECTVRNVVIEDSWNAAFYQTNFRDPPNPLGQMITFTRCHARRIAALNPFPYFCINNHASSTPLGTVVYDKCSYYSNKATMLGIIGEALGTQVTGVLVRNVVVTGFKITMEGMVDATSGNANAVAVLYSLATTPTVTPDLTLKDIEVIIRGNRTGSGNHFITGVRLDGAMALHIDTLTWDFDWTNAQGGAFKGLDIGNNATTVRGSIKRTGYRFVNPNNTVYAVVVRAAPTVVIPTHALLSIEDTDASILGGSSSATALTINGQPNVRLVRTQWPVAPGPSALTVGSSPYTYQNLDGYPELVSVGNDGGPVSKIEISGDNTTFTDVKLTIGQFQVSQGGSVRVTYSGTAPTMIKAPAS